MTGGSHNDLRILITEDHATTRVGIKQILREAFGKLDFGEAATAAETLTRLMEERWSLLILDISLPDRHGLEVLHEVGRHWSGVPVLIYSAHAEDQFAIHALRSGAAGYLSKERAPEELATAVRIILAGGKYISPQLARRLRSQAGDQPDLPHETLSKREFQVMRLTAGGRSGKAIAGELGVSQKTVSTYRARIMKKLQAANAAEMVQYAVRHGLM